MRIDRPIFCCQINREIHKYVGVPTDPTFLRTFLRSVFLSSARPIYAAHAQVAECFYDTPEVLRELAEAARLEWFVSLSKYERLSDFMDSRRRMYEWNRDAYPMYFSADVSDLSHIPTQTHGDPDTTTVLRGTYATLYQDGPPRFENRLTYLERKELERAAPQLRNFVSNESGPLTIDFFRKSPVVQEHPELDRLLSKILPLQFTNVHSGHIRRVHTYRLSTFRLL
jgi:hypothetical protein